MGEFSILTNARRAVIALIHSIVFLSRRQPANDRRLSSTRYVDARFDFRHRLDTLRNLSRRQRNSPVALFPLPQLDREGLLRLVQGKCRLRPASTIVGDHAFPYARYIRVIMLTCAVVLCTAIVRIQSQIAEGAALADEE